MKRNCKHPYNSLTILRDSVSAPYNRVGMSSCMYKLPAIPHYAVSMFDDSRYFQSITTGFSSVLQRAFESKVPVSFVEGDTIYRTVDGKIKEPMFDITPMIPIPTRSLKLK